MTVARGQFATDFWNNNQNTRSGVVVNLDTLTILGDQFDSHITGEQRIADFYRYLPAP